jgi:hypothetical protein
MPACWICRIMKCWSVFGSKSAPTRSRRRCKSCIRSAARPGRAICEGLVYLALLVGVGWTAIQHLPDLDPSRLTALWSGDRPSAGSPIVHNPNSATSQVHYPFQSKPAETTAPVPATSLASEAPPATSPSSEPIPPTVATLTPPSASVVFTAPPNPAPTPALSGADPP